MRGHRTRARWYKKKREEKQRQQRRWRGGARRGWVGRPQLICKWKGTEIEFYVRIELAIFFSQIVARREEVAAARADEREISRSTNGETQFIRRRRYLKRWMFPNKSRGRSLTCHEMFNSSPSPAYSSVTVNFVPANSRCLLTSPVQSRQEMIWLSRENRLVRSKESSKLHTRHAERYIIVTNPSRRG